MPTVVDIANLADVSVATVSRVIHNSNRVSDEKRERVMKAIETLGYKIDPNAESRDRRKTIMIICGNSQDEFIDSVFESAAESGFEVVVYYTAGHSVKVNSFMKRILKNKTVSGVITYGLTSSSKEAMEVINQKLSVVQCCDDLKLSNSFVVSGDDLAMSRDSVLHLLELGYKRIAFLGLGKMKHSFMYSENRFSGYKQALMEKGIEIREEYIAQCDYSNDSVEHALEQFMQAPVRPDAVFCVRDHTAMQLVNCATRRSLKIPDDLAVLGCGSIETAERCWLPLSNVSYPYFDIAMEAVSLLNQRIQGKLTLGRRVIIQHAITDRSTT